MTREVENPGGPAVPRSWPGGPAGRDGTEPSLRPLNAPRPIQVAADAAGEPLAVVLGGRRVRVAAVQDRWRIDDLWWRRPLSRAYFEVLLEDGRLLTVYHDLVDGGWAAQRYG